MSSIVDQFWSWNLDRFTEDEMATPSVQAALIDQRRIGRSVHCRFCSRSFFYLQRNVQNYRAEEVPSPAAYSI
jgi:hypothetical protein